MPSEETPWNDERDADDNDDESRMSERARLRADSLRDEADADMAFDPTYAGMGEWEPEVDDEAWIEAACDTINDVGARTYLRRLLASLRDSLGEYTGHKARDLMDMLAGHVLGRQVTGVSPLPGVPGALLVFDDNHAVPVVRPPWIRGPAPDFERSVGKYLVSLATKEDSLHPAWFELVFHEDADRAGEWHEAEGVVFQTLERSGQALYCPYDHGAPLPVPDDAEDVLDQLDAAVVGQRVAHQVRLPDGPAALVFDDWHVMPVARRRPGALNLESVVGRFLIWAEVVEEVVEDAEDAESEVFVELTFADDISLLERLRAAADEGDQPFERQLAEVQALPGVVVFEATLDSVAAVFLAAEDDEPDWEA